MVAEGSPRDGALARRLRYAIGNLGMRGGRGYRLGAHVTWGNRATMRARAHMHEVARHEWS